MSGHFLLNSTDWLVLGSILLRWVIKMSPAVEYTRSAVTDVSWMHKNILAWWVRQGKESEWVFYYVKGQTDILHDGCCIISTQLKTNYVNNRSSSTGQGILLSYLNIGRHCYLWRVLLCSKSLKIVCLSSCRNAAISSAQLLLHDGMSCFSSGLTMEIELDVSVLITTVTSLNGFSCLHSCSHNSVSISLRSFRRPFFCK